MNEIQLPNNLDDSMVKITKEVSRMAAVYETAFNGFMEATRVKDEKIKELEAKIVELTPEVEK